MPGWGGRREYSREFHRSKVIVRRRSGGVCEVHGDNPFALPHERKGPRCTRPQAATDHIVPQARGGGDSPEELQAICTQHHDKKTNAEAAEGRALRRGMARRPAAPHPGRRSREDF